MLRILFVEAAPSRHGSSLSMLSLIKELSARGHSIAALVHRDNTIRHDLERIGVHVKCLSGPSPLMLCAWHLFLPSRWVQWRSLLLQLAHASERLSISTAIRAFRDVIQFSRDQKEVRDFVGLIGADVIHLNNQVSTNRFAYIVNHGRPIVQHVRDAPLTDSEYIKGLSNKAAAFICISDFVLADVRSRYLVAERKALRIYNPIDADSQSLRHVSDSVSESTPKGLNLLYLGRVVQWKGVEDLLVAVGQVSSKHPACRLHLRVVGFDECSDYSALIRSKIRRLGVFASAHAYESDLDHHYRWADVLVHCPRKPEGFGRVVAESLVRGVPAIVTRTGGLAELVADEFNGFVLESVDELPGLLQSLLMNPSRLEKTRRGMSSSPEKRFARSEIASEVLRIYNEVVEVPRHR